MIDESDRFRQIKEVVAPIQGWVSDEAGYGLYQLALRHAPVPTVVELGSWRGRSTVWLGSAIIDRGEGKVYAVDRCDHRCQDEATQRMIQSYPDDWMFDQFRQTMSCSGVSDVVFSVRNDTVEAARNWNVNNPIGLLFIDADHDYLAVRRDFEHWAQFVCTGGFVVLDDFPSWAGPTQLALELPRWMRYVATFPNQIVFQKT